MHQKWFFKLSLMVVTLISFNACQDSEEEVTRNPLSEEVSNSHAITAEEALSTLNDFLKGSMTRSNSPLPRVMNVIPMKLENVATRAMATDAENVIYVANFSNNSGFAVLAADDRIQERVIAVADKSNLTKEDVDAVASFFKNKENYIDPDYPTTGNGLFTVGDYPDEVFLNPNTFSTYDETQDDNWVGNFSEEDSMPATRAIANPRYNHERIALSYCVDYAMDEIYTGSGRNNNSYTQIQPIQIGEI